MVTYREARAERHRLMAPYIRAESVIDLVVAGVPVFAEPRPASLDPEQAKRDERELARYQPKIARDMNRSRDVAKRAKASGRKPSPFALSALIRSASKRSETMVRRLGR